MNTVTLLQTLQKYGGKEDLIMCGDLQPGHYLVFQDMNSDKMLIIEQGQIMDIIPDSKDDGYIIKVGDDGEAYWVCGQILFFTIKPKDNGK